MSGIAISTERLGKRYRIGQRHARYQTLRQHLSDLFSANLRRGTSPSKGKDSHIWALRDVSLEIKSGDLVGIIGRNGAGKSTLLRILSRVTEPTEGYGQTRGRVGSLLEIGTGFHNELTGRENLYLSGALLGLRRAVIEKKFDEIVAFSGVEKFLDTPLKHYSTGMYFRLAFAVAAHLEPDILLVDEVLAVGDAAFQEKCLGKMGDVAKGGRTVLFVSHNMAAVRSLCRRGIVLSDGRISYTGDIDKSIESYYRSIGTFGAQEPDKKSRAVDPPRDRLGFGPVILAGRAGNTVGQSDEFSVSSVLRLPEPASGFSLSCVLKDAFGRRLFAQGANSISLGLKSVTPGLYHVTAQCPALWLSPGVYSLYFDAMLWTASSSGRCQSDTLPLDVAGANGGADAILHPDLQWSFHPL